MSQRLLFVINPISGTRDKSSLEKNISTFAREHAFTYNLYYTTGKNDAKAIQEQLSKYDPRTIIAVGGDGTCKLVAEQVMQTSKVMGIIPMGSANGLAKELNISNNLNQALNIISGNKTKTIDLVRINKHISLHLSDIGFNARVIRRFEKDTIRGMVGYAKHFIKEIKQHKIFKVTIQESLKYNKRYRASMVVIANATKYGTGALINPTGNISDGKLEIIVIRPYTFRHLIHLLYSLFTGTLHKVQYVKVLQGKKFNLINHKKQPLQIDGELIEPQKKIRVEIIPQALNILVP